MSASFSDLIPIILIGLVLLVIAVWAVMRLNSKTTVIDADAEKRDVLDENAGPAQRNQALIDSAPAAVKDNFGETSAVANVHSLATAPETGDSEAGANVTPTRDDADAKAETPPKSAPPASPAPPPVPKRIEEGETKDDLSAIKGVGPKLVARLDELGVTSFAQIAGWSESDIDAIDEQLGRFKGRIRRDQWVEQAKLLISNDKEAYAERFGKSG